MVAAGAGDRASIVMSQRALPLWLIAAALLMCWPALYNGQPFFHTDTSAYIRGATAGIDRLTGGSTAWSRPVPAATSPVPTPGSALQPAPVPGAAVTVPDTVLAGRSVYYGLLLYAGYAAGGFWFTVVVQALVMAAVVALALRGYGSLSPGTYALTMVMLSLTPAALYVSYLMPDIFGGFAMLACGMLMYAPQPPRTGERLFWFATLVYSLLAHTTNVLLCAAMGLMALVAYRWLSPRPARSGMFLVLLAVLLALAGEAAFSAGVRHFLGEAPLRPPFVMARVIEDGPGERYLRTHCDRSDLTVCRFADRLPLSADEFLWSEDPRRGVFAVTDPATRRALSAEQTRFVLAAVASDPVGQLRASALNFYNQLLGVRASEFTIWSGDRAAYASKLPPATWEAMQRSRAYRGEVAVDMLTALASITSLAGAAYLLVAIAGRALGRVRPFGAMPLALGLLFGVLANAAINGCLSVPHNRYQARVVWLLPFVALLVDFELRRAWWTRALIRLHLASPGPR